MSEQALPLRVEHGTEAQRTRVRMTAWAAFGIGVLTIVSTLDLAFEASSFLMARGYMWQTVKTLFLATSLILGYLLVVGAGIRSARIYLRTTPALAAFAWAMISLRSSPSERFHFIEYGLLYLLALRAVCIDRNGVAAYLLAVVATVLASAFDELAQGASAYRTGDWSDLRMNACAVLLAACVTLGLFGRDAARCRGVAAVT